MRKQKKILQDGDRKTKTSFLFLPKTLPLANDNSIQETRWLERTNWTQEYVTGDYGNMWFDRHWA